MLSAQEQINQEWFKQFDDVKESSLKRGMFAEDLALQTRVAFLKQRSLKELCRVAIYFDACCPKEWEAFMGSLDEGELKEKLQEEQRLRRGFYDLVYLAACKFAENHESAISFVFLLIEKYGLYVKFNKDVLEKPLGAEELLPQLLIALQTHFQENEKDNLLKIKNYIIPSHMDQYIGAETSYMIFSFTLAAACFSAEHAALNTHPISAKTNASIEAEISAPSFIKKVAESFAFIYEESLPDNAFIINSKFKLAAYFTAGAVIGLAVAAAVFFTGGLALPVLALAGVGLGAAAIGGFSLTGLTKGITSIVNTVQSRLLRWKLRLDITASLNEETSAPPIAVSVANEKIAATAQTSIAALHESAVPTLQVAVLSGVIEKLAENSPGIAEPTNASGTVYGENESDANLSVLSDDSMDGLEGTDSYSYSDSDLDLDSDLQIKSKNNYRIGALPFGSQFWKGDLKNEGQASMSEQRASIG